MNTAKAAEVPDADGCDEGSGAAQNHLLADLPPRDLERLRTAGEAVPLVVAQVLCEAGAVARDVYFPLRGSISLVTSLDEHPSLEVGMVGREGMVGEAQVLGQERVPHRALVQCEGLALRLGIVAFRAELRASAALRQRLERYIQVRLLQTATATACMRFHLIQPRLARWLLMSQDRAGSDTVACTHEFLAAMLGVRRVGITAAAGSLQRAGLIGYHRGLLTVRDRPGLMAAACSCYGADRAAYTSVMG